MNLIISGEYSIPPSELYAFRTLTMYANIIKHYDCLIEVQKENVDYYHKWLKSKYLYDFIEDLIYLNEENGVKIKYNIHNDRITYNNLNWYINML